MSKKIWTWEEAVWNGLLYDREQINLSRLYPEIIPYVLAFPKLEKVYTEVLRGENMKGLYFYGSVKHILTIYFCRWLNDEELKKNIGDYIAKYVLSINECGVVAKCIRTSELRQPGESIKFQCEVDISFKKDIVVKFENNDQDVYLEYPERDLYRVPS